MRTLVSTNSALIQFFTGPANRPAGSAIESIPNALEEPPVGLSALCVLLHHLRDRLRHHPRHELVPRGSVDAKLPQERLWKTECYILVDSGFQRFQCITE